MSFKRPAIRRAVIVLATLCGLGASMSHAIEVPFNFTDGFESGDKQAVAVSGEGAELFKWGGSVRAEVTNERARSGQYSLKFHYPAAADGSDSFAEQRFVIPRGASILTISFDLFVPENFFHRDQASSENNKFMYLWSGDYGTRASDQSVGFEYWPAFIAGGSPEESVLSHHLGPDDSDWGHKTPSRLPILSTADRGQWVSYSIFVKLSSELNSDGRIVVKKNDDLIFDVDGIDNYATSGNTLDQGYLLGWSNSGFSEDTDFYLDNFSIQVGQSPALPNPPVLEPPR